MRKVSKMSRKSKAYTVEQFHSAARRCASSGIDTVFEYDYRPTRFSNRCIVKLTQIYFRLWFTNQYLWPFRNVSPRWLINEYSSQLISIRDLVHTIVVILIISNLVNWQSAVDRRAKNRTVEYDFHATFSI